MVTPKPDALFAIEAFLRSRGDYQTLLALDALALRADLPAEEQASRIREIIRAAVAASSAAGAVGGSA